MPDADEPTYTLAEICAAARVQRATVHSWLSRHYVPVAPGLGMGRERRFSLLDAVRVAVLAEMTRLGLMVGVTTTAVRLITPDVIAADQLKQGRAGLVLIPAPASTDDVPAKAPPAASVRFRRFEDVEHVLRLRFGAPPVGFLMLDVTAIADRTRSALADPDGDWTAETWLGAPDSPPLKRPRKAPKK